MLNLSTKGISELKIKSWVLKNGLTNYLMSCASIDADSADYYYLSFLSQKREKNKKKLVNACKT